MLCKNKKHAIRGNSGCAPWVCRAGDTKKKRPVQRMGRGALVGGAE